MNTSDRALCTCCFVGHREICETKELKTQLRELLAQLIANKNADTFLFGSKSRFNSLCYDLVSELKEIHPHIKRVYVRAEFPIISDSYKAYLLEYYEDTYYPASIVGAGKAVYVKRNRIMIDNSQFCVFYCDEGYNPKGRESGTRIALAYAKKQNKTVYMFPRFCRGDH